MIRQAEIDAEMAAAEEERLRKEAAANKGRVSRKSSRKQSTKK